MGGYNLDLSRKHGIPFKTVIVTNHPPKVTSYRNPSIHFTPKIIVLSDRDADATIEQLTQKLATGEPINELELVYLPMYTSKIGLSPEQITITALWLSTQLPNTDTGKQKVQALLILLTSKFLDKQAFIRALEESYMYLEDDNPGLLFFEQKGMEKGMEKGMQKERVATILKLLSKGLTPQEVSDLIDLSIDQVQQLAGSQLAEAY